MQRSKSRLQNHQAIQGWIQNFRLSGVGNDQGKSLIMKKLNIKGKIFKEVLYKVFHQGFLGRTHVL